MCLKVKIKKVRSYLKTGSYYFVFELCKNHQNISVIPPPATSSQQLVSPLSQDLMTSSVTVLRRQDDVIM